MSKKCRCDECNGRGYVRCEDCDGEGYIDTGVDIEKVLAFDFLNSPKTREELVALQKDTKRVKQEHSRLCSMKPEFEKDYTAQLDSALEEIDTIAAAVIERDKKHQA